jgi:hypothetical protein
MVKEVQVKGNRANVIMFKTDLAAEQYEEVVLYTIDPLQLHGKKKMKSFVYKPSIPLACDRKLSIIRLKNQDLMSLCAADLIPKIYHSFYESLATVEDNPE